MYAGLYLRSRAIFKFLALLQWILLSLGLLWCLPVSAHDAIAASVTAFLLLWLSAAEPACPRSEMSLQRRHIWASANVSALRSAPSRDVVIIYPV